MSQRTGLFLVGLLCAFLTCAKPDREGPYPVVRIIDGDTIVVLVDGTQERVRLIGVDTPETVHPSKPVEEFGLEASAFTRNILEGQRVFLSFDQRRRDRYGRLLAYVYRASDDLFLNLEIIRQGYGHAYTRFPFKYMKLFRKTEREARKAERGLWGGTTDGQKILDEIISDENAIVFVTQSGRKYHRDGCRHLSGSRIEMSLTNANAQYQPCEICKPPVPGVGETP